MWPFGRKQRVTVREPVKQPGLMGWWLSAFTEEERDYIESKFQPMTMGIGGTSTTERHPILNTDGTLAVHLWELSSWFRSREDSHIAYRLLEKSEEVSADNILDLHFTYSAMIPIYYRDRDQSPAARENAIRICEKQIALAPEAAKVFKVEFWNDDRFPSHRGFHQLAIIREKEGSYTEAIRLSKEAQCQGWRGDWETRIERCTKRLAKPI